MSRGIGVEFCWVPSHCGFYWTEIDKLTKEMAMKYILCLKYHTITYYFHVMRFPQYLRKPEGKNKDFV